LKTESFRDLSVDLRRRKRLVVLAQFALSRVKRNSTAKIKDVYTILTLSLTPIAHQTRQTPVTPEDFDAKILEVILVGWDREKYWYGDVLHMTEKSSTSRSFLKAVIAITRYLQLRSIRADIIQE
jgi:hypothetical protein